MISIGYIGKAHGIRGELSVTPLTDDPSRFNKVQHVTLEYPDKHLEKLEIAAVRIHGNKIILKFHKVDSRDAAESLTGAYINIEREECPELPENSYYEFELVGLEVITTDGQRIGVLEEVLEYPANDVYVVMDGTREYLIPAVAAIIKKVDIKSRVMTIEPMEGLLEEER